eukprot:508754_1
MSSSQSTFVSLSNIPNLKHRSKFVVVFNEKTKELYSIQQGNDGLMQYSFTTDSWIKHTIDPPLNLERYNDYRDPNAPTAAINSDKKLIYLFDTYFMAKIQLFNDKNFKLERITAPDYIGSAPKGVIINNEFHLIGHNNHYKYDEELNEFLFQHELESNREEIEWIENHGLAKVNDKVLIFGGRSDPEHPTFEFDFGYTDTIRSYDIINDKWTKLNVKTHEAFQGFGCTSILNGKYILVIGGEQVEDGSGWPSDEIHIYSVNDETFKKSKIKCPEGLCGQYQAITVSDAKKDELISFGYMRSEWNKCGVNSQLFPPEYLIRIINRYYFDEFVHLFHSDLNGNGAHHKISVFDII